MDLNVLQMIHSIEKGGAETYLFKLLEKPRDDIRFFIVCNHKGSNHNKLISNSDNVEIIRMKNIFDFKAARKLANYCKENVIHIIQTHFLRESYIALLSKLFNPDIKIIWTGHLLLNNSRLIKILNRIASKFVDRIICVSKAVETSFINEGISRKKTKLIYNGVDTDHFKAKKDSHIRDQLGIEKNILVLTTISRFHEEKGHRFLIEGLRELKTYLANFIMLFVGQGEEEDAIREMVKDYDLEDKVIFLGYREDIRHILGASDIYISPSKNEAISFSILEALSCGLPVIATAVGGVPEIFGKGLGGILIPFGDKVKLVEAIIQLANNEDAYRILASNSRGIVVEYFSQSFMLKETYDLYDEILSQ